jgi:hypothetical protein
MNSPTQKVGIAQPMHWTAWLRFLEVQDFFHLHRISISSGDHQASYPMGTCSSFRSCKVGEA